MTSSAQRVRPMTVGELSRRTGVPIKTLRQYTDWGSRARLTARIAELQQTVHRIDEFEATHETDLAGQLGGCWMGDPRCGASA
jgi:MerR family transcriptional regulator, copper efflux regulator